MFDEGHRFGRMEGRRATKRNVNYPTLAQPARMGHPRKETRGKIKSLSHPPWAEGSDGAGLTDVSKLLSDQVGLFDRLCSGHVPLRPPKEFELPRETPH